MPVSVHDHPGARRNLRARNLIQLHPYLVEGQLYRKALKSRGLKPVQVTAESPGQKACRDLSRGQSENASAANSSDSQSTFISGEIDSSQEKSPCNHKPDSTSRQGDRSSKRHVIVDASLPPQDGENEDEFPDLDVLLRNNVTGAMRTGFKRRRTMPAGTGDGSTSVPALTTMVRSRSPGGDVHRVRYSTQRESESNQSSPGLSEQLEQSLKPTFKVPRGVSPLQLPTPLYSSSPKGLGLTALPDTTQDLDGDILPQAFGMPNTPVKTPLAFSIGSSSTSNASSMSGSETEVSASSQLRHAQKQIRGVLPASWLRMDRKPLKEAHKRSESGHSAMEHRSPFLHRRGIAQKLSGSVTTPATHETAHISLESSPTAADNATPKSVRQYEEEADMDGEEHYQPRSPSEDDGGVPLNVEEYNWIDPMLPRASRLDNQSRGTRKRRKQLNNSVVRSKHTQHVPGSAPKRISKRTKTKSAATQPRSTIQIENRGTPRLSIIDLTEPFDKATNRAPQFVRLITRTARHRKDKGRHSPSRKLIRLQTYADTEEANAVLREWRTGAILPSRASADTRHQALIPRLPLQNRSENVKPSGSLVAVDKTALESHSLSSGSRKNMMHAQSSLPPEPRFNLRQSKLKVVVRRSGVDRRSIHRVRDGSASISPASFDLRYLRAATSYRAAQLESTDEELSSSTSKIAFARQLAQMNQNPSTTDRCVHMDSPQPESSKVVSEVSENGSPTSGRVAAHTRAARDKRELPIRKEPRCRKKWLPKRLDVDLREYRQPSESLLTAEYFPAQLQPQPSNPVLVLLGLQPYGFRYPVTFDVSPLLPGTFFHETTFIGCGELERALSVITRVPNCPKEPFTLNWQSRTYSWDEWTDDVASDFAHLSAILSQHIAVQSHQTLEDLGASAWSPCALLRSVITYCSDHLRFIDAIDHRLFVNCSMTFVNKIVAAVAAVMDTQSDDSSVRSHRRQSLSKILAYALVLCVRAAQVGRQYKFEPRMRAEIEELIRTVAGTSCSLVLNGGLCQLTLSAEQNKRVAQREAGIRNDEVDVQSVVILNHALEAAAVARFQFWDMVRERLKPCASSAYDVQGLDGAWSAVFAFLPFLELDASGLLVSRRPFLDSNDGWSFVKILLGRLFDLYPETSKRRTSTLNAYVRACLERCYHLINTWGWWRCESILGFIFDFFGRNGLAHLHHEEYHGSPEFLTRLSENPNMSPQPEDRGFHIFLKILASGLSAMKQRYPSKRISGIIWRFIPNHGRTYQRDEPLLRKDLDALRNHHDLLCTLYWASPPGFRPRIDVLRNLVDHSCSHLEACRLNVRAWSILAKFQLSSNEPPGTLEPLGLWYRDILEQNLSQLGLARTGLEDQYSAVQDKETCPLSSVSQAALVTSMQRNQASILAILSDLLAAMRNAIRVAKSGSDVTTLLEISRIHKVLEMYSPDLPELRGVVIEALNTLGEYAAVLETSLELSSQNSSEESQDYGEWPELYHDAVSTEISESATQSLDFITEALAHLRSNCFGSETLADEDLLLTLVNTWTVVARCVVRKGQRDWSSYLDPYSTLSWHQLRDTEQTRKFAALFLAKSVEGDRTCYDRHKSEFLTSWMLSLVERDSLLKYQHHLTMALLNSDPENPLLHNLPFLRDSRTRKLEISLPVLRERRIHLISCVLANLRASYDARMHTEAHRLPELRLEYSSMLRQIMAAMKRNYQESGQNMTAAGGYVSFVHRVIELMQQHTADICPLDKFFTDSAVFPLPATDPTYVVGRLKSYRVHTTDWRTLKQLAIFVQTVTERAIVDDQQRLLVEQLSTAMRGPFEGEGCSEPSLRTILMQAIFPAYVELAFRSPTGWLFGTPILQAMSSTFDTVIYDFSISDKKSASAALSAISDVICLIGECAGILVDHSGLLDEPHTLHLLAVVFRAATAALAPLDYIQRGVGCAQKVVGWIRYLRSFGTFVAKICVGRKDAPGPLRFEDNDVEEAHAAAGSNRPFAVIRQFCSRELDLSLRTHWVRQGEEYWLVRGPLRQQAAVKLGNVTEERTQVCCAIDEFRNLLDRLPSFGSTTRPRVPLRRSIAEVVV